VGAVDDPREGPEGRVSRQALGDELLEGAAPLPVTVRVAGAGGVEADRPLPLLHSGHLPRLDEEDLGLGIEETADEPDGGRPVDVDPATGDPFHAAASWGERGWEGSVRAAQSVPRPPRAAATAKVKLGRTVQRSPPSVAAPATAKPRSE